MCSFWRVHLKVLSHVMDETAKHVQQQHSSEYYNRLSLKSSQHSHSQSSQTLVKHPVKLLHAPLAAPPGSAAAALLQFS
jgi:arsenate reductase-like glutaredoxin family protein